MGELSGKKGSSKENVKGWYKNKGATESEWIGWKDHLGQFNHTKTVNWEI